METWIDNLPRNGQCASNPTTKRLHLTIMAKESSIIPGKQNGALPLAVCFVLGVLGAVSIPSRASEYEVEGKIHQTIVKFDGTQEEFDTQFKVFVRDCGWLIKMVDEDRSATGWRREVGSTNGWDIFEYSPRAQGLNRSWFQPTQGSGTNRPWLPDTWESEVAEYKASSHPERKVPNNANITRGNVPVGVIDREVVGHIWLMYASQCYWSTLKSGLVTPLYDFNASAPGDPLFMMKAPAKWELLDGAVSLPQEVSFPGGSAGTNVFYRATGTMRVGSAIIPSGFVFEQRDVVYYSLGTRARKRIQGVVTAARPVCSLTNLLPVPEGFTLVIDWRLKGSDRSSPLPNYVNPVPGTWPTLDESKALAKAHDEQNAKDRTKTAPSNPQPNPR